MNGPVYLGAILLSAMAAVSDAEPAAKRTWTARNGKFKVEAVLIDFDEKKVRLRREDGKLLSVELKKLSRADRKYVDAQQAAKAKQQAAKNKPADEKPVRNPTAADKKALQGRWQMIYIERNGIAEDLTASVFGQYRLDFSGDKVSGFLGDQKFKIDGFSDPKQMVMVRVKPDKVSRPIRAIYSLEGDVLKICRSSRLGGPPPKKMETKKGDGKEIAAFKRIARK